jgi:hypothetical protein
MKNLLFFALAITALSIASCGNGDRAANNVPETIAMVENDVSITPVDSDSVLVTDVQAEAVGVQK